VRGVGGTRNCDWWFTNEAILLDTAGRYTTESDDRDEWIASSRCSSATAEEADQRRARGHQRRRAHRRERAADRELRQEDPRRIDEVMTQLQMVVPVYVLFTKSI
jgi:type VI secretion system protein ImpL